MDEYEYIITVNYGLADVSIREVRDITGRSAEGSGNIVWFRGSEDDAYKLILWGRTIHRVLLKLCGGSFETLDDLGRGILREVDFRRVYGRGLGFALRTVRLGRHPFTSMDVNRIIGGLIHRRLMGEGLDPYVDLDEPDIEFILRIINDRYVFTINLTGESLHKRGYRIYRHPAALMPSIAAAMINLSGWGDEVFIDPMAGSGTIPIEAAIYKYRIAPGLYRGGHPIVNIPLFSIDKYMEYRDKAIESRIVERLDTRIIYNDINRLIIDGALLNSDAASVSEYIEFYNYDARELDKYLRDIGGEPIAVMNPPYGIRMTRLSVIPALYDRVVGSLSRMNVSRIVTITSRHREMIKAMESNKYRVDRVIRVMYGNLESYIIICGK